MKEKVDPPIIRKLKIKCEEVNCEDIQLGELFSTAGHDYWNNVHLNQSVGERVYIRNVGPVPKQDIGTKIFRITIEK